MKETVLFQRLIEKLKIKNELNWEESKKHTNENWVESFIKKKKNRYLLELKTEAIKKNSATMHK